MDVRNTAVFRVVGVVSCVVHCTAAFFVWKGFQICLKCGELFWGSCNLVLERRNICIMALRLIGFRSHFSTQFRVESNCFELSIARPLAHRL